MTLVIPLLGIYLEKNHNSKRYMFLNIYSFPLLHGHKSILCISKFLNASPYLPCLPSWELRVVLFIFLSHI